MKRFSGFLACILTFFWLISSVAFGALLFPKPQGYVNDFVGVLSTEQKANLERKLVAFEKETTHELVVVIVPDLQDTPLEEYAVKLFQEWGIGKKDKNNGVLLLLAMKKRQIRIEVGYGLEPVLTDGTAGSIIRRDIVPYFKSENYAEGIEKGVDTIMKVTMGEVIPDAPPKNNDGGSLIIALFVILAGVVQYGLAYLARTKTWWAGGVGGILLGVIIALIARISFIFGFPLVIGLGGIGLLLDFLLSKNYEARKKQGLSTSWVDSRGGFYGSNSSFGGGSFGGGRSGGGGSRGSW